MQFNVASLLQEHTGATREFDIDDALIVDGTTRRITGHMRLDRTPRGVLVRARVGGDMQADCSRCLRPLSFRVTADFDEEFLPAVDIETGQRVEPLKGEEDAYRITSRHVLDLAEPVRQYWAMAQPMAPVCDEDCNVQCPICGRDRTASGHERAGEPADNRWAKLAEVAKHLELSS